MKCLVIGGNGFLGYSVVEYLAKHGYEVICFSLDECRKEELIPSVKYVIGNVWDEDLLKKNLDNVDVVLDFLSTTLPNSNAIYLDDEINKTLKYLNYLLSILVAKNVKHYIFPSSGGAIYGNTDGKLAKEDKVLEPCTPYGVGKKMAEDIIRYYNQRFGISTSILRIGNIYGSKLKRERPQGVVDILVQKAISGESFEVWGNALESKRDYVFLEDVAEAVYLVIEKCEKGKLNIFNIGSGEGKSLQEIIDIVERKTGKPINIISDKSKMSGVNQIALSVDKIYKEIGWKPRTSLEDGVTKTIEFKERKMN